MKLDIQDVISVQLEDSKTLGENAESGFTRKIHITAANAFGKNEAMTLTLFSDAEETLKVIRSSL